MKMKMYPIMIDGAVGIGKALYHRIDAIVVIADIQEVQAKQTTEDIIKSRGKADYVYVDVSSEIDS